MGNTHKNIESTMVNPEPTNPEPTMANPEPTERAIIDYDSSLHEDIVNQYINYIFYERIQ
jgi:hypothetical protein